MVFHAPHPAAKCRKRLELVAHVPNAEIHWQRLELDALRIRIQQALQGLKGLMRALKAL